MWCGCKYKGDTNPSVGLQNHHPISIKSQKNKSTHDGYRQKLSHASSLVFTSMCLLCFLVSVKLLKVHPYISQHQIRTEQRPTTLNRILSPDVSFITDHIISWLEHRCMLHVPVLEESLEIIIHCISLFSRY